jgi:hypothetical protein
MLGANVGGAYDTLRETVQQYMIVLDVHDLINHVVFDIYQIVFHNVLLFLDLVALRETVQHMKQPVYYEKQPDPEKVKHYEKLFDKYHVVFDIYQIVFHNVLLFLDLVVFHSIQVVSCVVQLFDKYQKLHDLLGREHPELSYIHETE